MDITVKPKEERKLVAVLGSGGRGIFFRRQTGAMYLDPNEDMATSDGYSLEGLLNQCSDRTPIYEGDEITIKF